MSDLYDIRPMLDAYRGRQVGRVAWELAKLNAALEALECTDTNTRLEAEPTPKRTSDAFIVRYEDT
jgi:hypothetical protein